MSRTVVLNLLWVALPLLVVHYLPDSTEFHFWTILWIFFQVALWGCAIVLLRRDPISRNLALLAIAVNVLSWVLVCTKMPERNQIDGKFALALGVEFAVAALVTLFLRYGSALVNVRASRVELPTQPKVQFQLSQLFSISACVAVVMAVFLYRQRNSIEPAWVIALEFLQVGSWLWIAESLLRPRIRWISSLLLLVALGSTWYFYLTTQREFGSIIFILVWVPFQGLDILLPLLYRWAGWRIVPRERAEHLLYFADVKRPADAPLGLD